eukprot:2151215-Heterocapsa_arctica.AAC.1
MGSSTRRKRGSAPRMADVCWEYFSRLRKPPVAGYGEGMRTHRGHELLEVTCQRLHVQEGMAPEEQG